MIKQTTHTVLLLSAFLFISCGYINTKLKERVKKNFIPAMQKKYNLVEKGFPTAAEAMATHKKAYASRDLKLLNKTLFEENKWTNWVKKETPQKWLIKVIYETMKDEKYVAGENKHFAKRYPNNPPSFITNYYSPKSAMVGDVAIGTEDYSNAQDMQTNRGAATQHYYKLRKFSGGWLIINWHSQEPVTDDIRPF